MKEKIKAEQSLCFVYYCLLIFGIYLVGATGFEPAASWSRTKRATKLRYAPAHSY